MVRAKKALHVIQGQKDCGGGETTSRNNVMKPKKGLLLSSIFGWNLPSAQVYRRSAPVSGRAGDFNRVLLTILDDFLPLKFNVG